MSSINSVFKNAETYRSEIEATKIKDKNIDLISDLKKQLMPPDYLLTAIQCGLLKETQDNKNDEDENENDDKDDEDPLNALKIGGDDDNEDDNEKSGDDFDSENDPILGNKQLVEDDDDFFESCSDDDDEEEEEKHEGFFPWS